MADETQQDIQGQAPETVNDVPVTSDIPSDSDDGTFSAEYVKKLRDEAAKYRVRAKEHEERLAQLEAERKQREQQELVQNEEWKTLAEKREQELNDLQAKIQQQTVHTLRMQTIQELGLPTDAMEFLTGNDAETIKAQAEKFKSLIPDVPEARSQQPRQNTRSMSVIPGGEPTNETREQKYARIYGGRFGK